MFTNLMKPFLIALMVSSNISIVRAEPSRCLAAPNHPLRVLIIDGGGVRGIIPAIVVQEIEKQVGKPISEIVDVFGGTSVGGILSLGYTLPKVVDGKITNHPEMSAEDMVKMNDDFAKAVFVKQHKIKSIKKLVEKGAQYSVNGLEDLLEKHFKDIKISQTLKPVYITSFDLKSESTFIISTSNAKIGGNDASKEKRTVVRDMADLNALDKSIDKKTNWVLDLKMKDAARATSAAPLYFNPLYYQHNTPGGVMLDLKLVDGGIGNNSPSSAILVALSKDYCTPPAVEVISIGTGVSKKNPEEEKTGIRNITDQVFGTINGLFTAQDENSTDASKELVRYLNIIHPTMKSTYTRLQVYLDKTKSALDDTSPDMTAYLKERGEFITNTQQFKDLITHLKQLH